MTLEGWIFMVGLRVLDVGALVVWLVWFLRHRDDEDDEGRDGPGPGKGEDPPPEAPRPGGLGLPLPGAAPWPSRRRDHLGDRPSSAPASPRRTPAPLPVRAPSRHS